MRQTKLRMKVDTDGWVLVADGKEGVYLTPSEADFVFAKLKERDSNMRAAREVTPVWIDSKLQR